MEIGGDVYYRNFEGVDSDYGLIFFLFTWFLKTNSMLSEYVSEYESVSRICV